MTTKHSPFRWGTQKFLNPVVSWDSGSIKLAVTKKPYDGAAITFELRDCDKAVDLNFDISDTAQFTPNGKVVSADDLRSAKDRLKRMRQEARERRKKINILVDALQDFAGSIDYVFELSINEQLEIISAMEDSYKKNVPYQRLP